MKIAAVVALVLCCAALSAAEAAKPLLHPLFSTAAVLQRDKPLAVWGWAAPGASVTVALAGGTLAAAPATAIAGADGRWQASLGPFAAGGPYVLTARSGEREASAKDVLIGDVWLCSGQSNMEFAVGKAKDAAAEIAAANLPGIRQFALQPAISPEELQVVQARWQACSPGCAGRFTAVGFFMARQLHAELQVPIGIIHSSWGGTNAESWVGAATLSALPEKDQLEQWNRTVAAVRAQEKIGKDYATLLTEWFAANDPGSTGPGWAAPAVDDAGWKNVRLPAVLEEAGGVAKDFDGTIWLRRSIIVPEAAAGKGAKLALGRITAQDVTWIDGTRVGSGDSWRVVRNYDVPAALLKPGPHTIAIRILNEKGTTGLAEVASLALDDGPSIPLNGAWRCRPGVALTVAPPLPAKLGRGATAIYNAMIAPLAPMTLRGVAWYQGENNADRAYRYRALLLALIADWRGRFADPQLPFLIVQLANYKARSQQPQESSWAELREAQAMAARSVGHAGLAVAIDVGEAGDVHPTNKQAVGQRLALAALAIAHGRDVEWSGPWYTGMQVEGAAIRVRFDHARGLAAADGGRITGFAVAGADRSFVWADARIDGDSVVVSAPQVAQPVAVRYAWGKNPACNLTNAAGLPAVPFRSDDWPGLTWPKADATTAQAPEQP